MEEQSSEQNTTTETKVQNEETTDTAKNQSIAEKRTTENLPKNENEEIKETAKKSQLIPPTDVPEHLPNAPSKEIATTELNQPTDVTEHQLPNKENEESTKKLSPAIIPQADKINDPVQPDGKKSRQSTLKQSVQRSTMVETKGEGSTTIPKRLTDIQQHQGSGDGPFGKIRDRQTSSSVIIEDETIEYLLGKTEKGSQVYRTQSMASERSESLRSIDHNQPTKGMMIKYMNTYRLDSHNPFRREPVYNIIRDVLNNELETMSYDPSIFSKACAVLAAEIRNRVKALAFERYKLVCIVQITEKNRQSINTIAKFLWDPDRDNCASYCYENMYLLASGAVFGLYYE